MPQFRPFDALSGGDSNFTDPETFNADLTTPPTNGQFLEFDAMSETWKPVSLAAAAAGVLTITTYEVGTGGTYAIPDNAVALEIEGAGAGANGSAGSTSQTGPGGAGGRGGEHNTQYLPLTAGTGRTLTVTIGTAGGNTTLTGTNITDQTWEGAYYAANSGNRTPVAPTFVQHSGFQGGDSRARGGDGGSAGGGAGSAGGGGGGGWVLGAAGGVQNGPGGAGGHGGMVIKALGITVTVG